ncbi:MAG: type IV pilus twitching motility protein PilT [bacterium]
MDIISLLSLTKEKDASDLHISSGAPPMNRIYGRLEKISDEIVTKEDVQKMLYSLLNDTQKARFERDMELDFSIEIQDLARFRVNAYSQRRGTSIAFRLIPDKIKPLKELGLPLTVEDIALAENGFILVTGPTGCGKSTTLATMIDIINQKRSKHIITIEDPIEYVHHNKNSLIDQREIETNTKSFYGGLRSALREDPNVILVGEMRDLETISMALTAAETGHLVMATLHTNNAPQTINRIVDVFPPAQQQQIRTQLADTLEGVISQILIPTIDEKARVCACEVMVGNMAIKNMIREGKVQQMPSLIQTGRREGMQTMDQSLEALVMEGKITKQEAFKRATNKSIFKEYSYM